MLLESTVGSSGMLLFITVTWFYIQTVFTTDLNYNNLVTMWKRDDFVLNK